MKCRMKVLLVDLSKRFGGADIRILQTAMHLSQDCEIATAVLAGSPVHRKLEAAGLRTFPIARSRHDPRTAVDLARAARSFDPDIIDAHNPQSQLWGMLAAAMSGVRGRLVTVHTVYRVAHRGWFRQRSHELALRLARRLGARFLTVSGSIEDYVKSLGVPGENVYLSYNALEPAESGTLPAGLRAALGLDAGELLLGIVGRVESVKGHDILIEAMDILRGRGKAFHLIVVGTGRDEEDLKRLVESKGLGSQVHMLGFRRDIPEILADIDIFCAPSRSEGLPYTVLEAARQGVPVIAASVDGLAEVLEDDRTASIIPPESPLRLADAIEELAADEARRRRLGRAGKEMIDTRFAIPRMTEETLAIYRRIAGTATP
jgi:glycosyltransferase involved in cell wall biosynthesis